MSGPEIIFKELMPNMLPYLGASFVAAVSTAILFAIGLEVLGLGPQTTNTLGMTIYWSQLHSAVIRGLWWWWLSPMVVIVTLIHWAVSHQPWTGRTGQPTPAADGYSRVGDAQSAGR